MQSVLAADLGGTKCRFALVDEELGVHGASTVETPGERHAFLETIDRTFRELRDDLPSGVEPPAAIGIGTAGVISSDGQRIETAPNLPVSGFDLGAHLSAIHALPAMLSNDGRASAWGEYMRGHAAGSDPLLVLFFGTGIGIGTIVEGQPYCGANNAAGEVGHVLHVAGGRTCACGRSGCYEAYCGGGPMTRRAAEELGERDRWTVGDIVAAAENRSEARAILDEAELAAGAMVAGLCTLWNPAAVVLGGGVTQGWPELPQKIERYVRAWCAEPVTRELEFVASLGQSDAILWGAALATGKLSHATSPRLE